VQENTTAENTFLQYTNHTIVMDVRDITKSLPLGRERIDILRGISFQIMGGEFVSIMGPSGSGKSTLLGIIAGLDNPTSGQVLIDGIDITTMSESKLAGVRNNKIGMVFQAFNLIPTLTAQENVEVPLYVGKHKGSPSVRAKELLELVGLGTVLFKYDPHVYNSHLRESSGLPLRQHLWGTVGRVLLLVEGWI